MHHLIEWVLEIYLYTLNGHFTEVVGPLRLSGLVQQLPLCYLLRCMFRFYSVSKQPELAVADVVIIDVGTGDADWLKILAQAMKP